MGNCVTAESKLADTVDKREEAVTIMNLEGKILEDNIRSGSSKRIRIVITKQQLQDWVAKQLSAEDILIKLQKSTRCVDGRVNWKPKLDCIPEGNEWQ